MKLSYPVLPELPTSEESLVYEEQKSVLHELAQIALEVGASGGVCDEQLTRIAVLRARILRIEAGL